MTIRNGQTLRLVDILLHLARGLGLAVSAAVLVAAITIVAVLCLAVAVLCSTVAVLCSTVPVLVAPHHAGL